MAIGLYINLIKKNILNNRRKIVTIDTPNQSNGQLRTIYIAIIHADITKAADIIGGRALLRAQKTSTHLSVTRQFVATPNRLKEGFQITELMCAVLAHSLFIGQTVSFNVINYLVYL